jgi:hypothetical protein
MKKYYVTRGGRNMCITDDYNTALLISKNQPNRVKEFQNYHLALKLLYKIVDGGIQHSTKPTGNFIHLDVSVNKSNGNAEFRVMRGSEILLTANTLQYCTPNIAEFLALVEAHKYANHYALDDEAIYCDNIMAIRWFKAVIEVQIPPTVQAANPHLVELVEKAKEYLRNLPEDYDLNVHHWDKSMWGEIPSDYNRKKPQINETLD